MLSSAEVRGPGKFLRLLPAERLMLTVVGILLALSFVIALSLDRKVFWPPFLTGYGATLGLAAVGAYIRRAKAMPRFALALIGFAIYAGFTSVAMVFVFILLPIGRPLIDPTLIGIDAVMGYHWPALVSWLADYPVLSNALAYVYLSSQQQIILTIILLSVLSRDLQLHRFLAVGIMTLLIAVAFWWIAPSAGPSAFLDVPQEDIAAAKLHFTPEFGQVLRSLIQDGPEEVNPSVITGIIAFPSYHIIMSMMVVWFTRRTLAFIPLALWNIPMIPAVLGHGAHHLVDLIGGLAVFVLGVAIANRLFPAEGAT